MPVRAAPGERYTIRRKILKIFGNAFHIYDAEGGLAGFAKQRAFRLREDIRIYTDESCSAELLVLNTQQIIDFSATYAITLPSGEKLGSLRRKGVKSTMLRDEWMMYDEQDQPLGVLRELGSVQPLVRRYVDDIAVFFPQRFEITRVRDGAHIATIRQHFNPLVYRLGLAIRQNDERFDDLMLLATTCLIAAIEGRQD